MCVLLSLHKMSVEMDMTAMQKGANWRKGGLKVKAIRCKWCDSHIRGRLRWTSFETDAFIAIARAMVA